VEHGNSVIVHPTGKILAGPAQHQETILYADVDLAAVHAARRFFDPVGHYSRPDIFQLRVDTGSRPPVITHQPPDSETPAEPAPQQEDQRMGTRQVARPRRRTQAG